MNTASQASRWRTAALISTVGLLVWFLILRKCLVYWTTNRTVLIVLIPPVLLYGFLVLRWKGRIVLAVGAAVGSYFFLPPHINPMPIAASESSAVRVLVEMSSSQEERQATHIPTGTTPGFPVERFYRFEYHPNQKGNGFEVTATLLPAARSCGCIRSFLFTSERVLHYTSEPRPATERDPVVEIPPTLLLGAFAK